MIICIEGNIGSGKTTLLRTLRFHFGHIVVEEPMAAWKFWLDNPHCDKEFFQCIVLQWYIIVGKKFQNCEKPIYVERSPFTSKHVFSTKLFNRKSQLSQVHAQLYAKASELFVPSAYVFLTTPPSVCKKRLLARGQAGDAFVHSTHLRNLDALHWKTSATLHANGMTVIHLDDS